MNGILYAVGVGPGDPELLTLKAVKTIKEADCIACVSSGGEPGIAYRIAIGAVPEMSDKEILPMDFPMQEGDLSKAHEKAALLLSMKLESGKNVAFLTLGDPGFYSGVSYILDAVKEKGFDVRIVSGIPSFSAASAKLMIPLATGRESVTISAGEYRKVDGTLVILKAGKNLKSIKQAVSAEGKHAWLVENCGMENERVYKEVGSMPDEAGYFSLMIVK